MLREALVFRCPKGRRCEPGAQRSFFGWLQVKFKYPIPAKEIAQDGLDRAELHPAVLGDLDDLFQLLPRFSVPLCVPLLHNQVKIQ
jgi:hypothetical protein